MMLEKDVEKSVKRYAESKGWITRKWTSPGYSFVPDQIFLNYVPPEHRELIAKYIRFVEMKRPGGKCTPGQLREHTRLRDQGFAVDVIDSIPDGREMVDRLA
jgi:hypothetical protein